jgi:hypothetical protein
MVYQIIYLIFKYLLIILKGKRRILTHSLNPDYE